MKTLVWIDRELVPLLHRSLIAEHGGSLGIRDAGLLESALTRPEQLHAYGKKPDVFALAAAYAFGISKTHPFVDGNKRVALVLTRVFLLRNGYELDATNDEKYHIFYGLASGSVSEDDLAQWLRVKACPIEGDK